MSHLRAQYVWGPGDGITGGGADELLCQFDPVDTSASGDDSGAGKPWYILTDAQGDVVSVVHVPNGTNTSAEVGGQWTYSPYGEVLTYEQFYPHPALVFGHKTLAIDRLDGEALSWDSGTGTLFDTRRLEPGARLIGYARNRTLDVRRGRWLQVDPNESGALVVDQVRWHGARLVVESPPVDLRIRTSDGLGLATYARANSIQNSDPLGLLVGMILPGPEDILMGGFRALRGGLEEMVGQYGANQELDLDWALDWSQEDSFHSRMENGWVQESFNAGAWNAFIDEMDPTGGYLSEPFMAGAASGAAKAVKKAKHLTGQLHHAISTKVHRALQDHKNLKDVYKKRDNDWTTQAGKLDDHKGYQTWHRKYDGDVVAWIKQYESATPAQFEHYLKGLYRKGELAEKFPSGLRGRKK